MSEYPLNAETAYRSLAVSDVIASFDTHAGLKIASIGEDGDHLILGHHDDAACWAAFESITGEPSGVEWYDLRRTQVGWANHSEDCEVTSCSCADDRCDACNSGDHGACAVPDDCVCGDWDHDATCRCECFCDEYAWWVSDVQTNGEPATWVSWSHAKASARREALRNPPVSRGDEAANA